MQLLADRSFVQAPGTCIVCNRAPDEGQPVVDTLHNLTLGIPSLDGRIYVCFGCAHSIAQTIGYVSEEAEQAAVQAAADAKAQFDALKAKVDAVFGEINVVAETPVVAEEDFETAMTRFGVDEPVEDEAPEDEVVEEADEEDEDA